MVVGRNIEWTDQPKVKTESVYGYGEILENKLIPKVFDQSQCRNPKYYDEFFFSSNGGVVTLKEYVSNFIIFSLKITYFWPKLKKDGSCVRRKRKVVT